MKEESEVNDDSSIPVYHGVPMATVVASDNAIHLADGVPVPVATVAALPAPAPAVVSSKPSSTNTSASSAWSRVGTGSAKALGMFNRLRTEGRGLMEQSSQHVLSALQKGADTGTVVSGKVTSALAESRTKMKSTYIALTSVGESVQTLYGNGKVLAYNESSGMYQIQLSFGTLYTNSLTVQKKKARTALELNSAYEVWEKNRRRDVECQCTTLGIPFTETTMQQCFTCLATPAKSKPMLADATGKPLFPNLYNLRTASTHTMSRQTDAPCLLCGAVVCSQHSSDAFRKEGITVCDVCVVHLEFDCSTVTRPEELETHIQHLVELYGRARLLLQYSSQFLLATADSLEEKTKQHNHIGVGGSSAGLVSELKVFGGSATAVQTGSEAYKYYSEPNQFANRIITLHGILEMILATVKFMRDSTLLPYLDQAVLRASPMAAAASSTANGASQAAPAKVAVRAGTRIGSMASTSAASMVVQESVAMVAVQEGAMAGRFASRATTAAVRTARFARFAGGALSAATIALEANEMRKTVEQIQQGNPCDKAKALRDTHTKTGSLPTSTYVERMCQSYLKVRSKELFQQAVAGVSLTDTPPTDPGASPDMTTAPGAPSPGPPVPRQEEDWCLVEEVLSSLEAEAISGKRRPKSKASLLERVRRYKERELQSAENHELHLVE